VALPGETASEHRLTVGADGTGVRLDLWLASRFPAFSRSRLRALISAGHVSLGGRRAKAATRLTAGQTVRIRWPDVRAAVPEPEEIPLHVVHDDDGFLVVDKAAGLTVHPGAGRASGTLVNALLHHVRDLSGIGGVLRPGIVHRLDRGTSGLLVVAKNDGAHRSLAQQFEARTVEKEYLALVLGVPARRQGAIEAPIGRHPVQRKRMTVRATGGRSARSDYSVVEAFDGAALLRVRIHTGRTHQVRVHLASIGHPVAGDAVYGGTRVPPSRRAASRAALGRLTRPALHAARLAFDHPVSGGRLVFESPLPADLAEVVKRLREARV
jgi:23S rRNA pseudouridine1911/1915/1917 synthase